MIKLLMTIFRIPKYAAGIVIGRVKDQKITLEY